MKKFYNYIPYLGFLQNLGFVLLFGAEPFKAPLMLSISIVVIIVALILSLLILISLLQNKFTVEDFRKKMLMTSFYLLLLGIMIILWIYK